MTLKLLKIRLVQTLFLILIWVFLTVTSSINAACKDREPGGKPNLLSADSGEQSVSLTWEKAPDPVTYYLVRYGLTKENLEYGLPNIGDRNTTSFTVQGLTNGQKYFFQVRAGNGCRPGDFSDTVNATPGEPKVVFIKPNLSLEKQVLAITATAKKVETEKNVLTPNEKPIQKENCAFTCYSFPILIGELAFLAIFLLLSIKYRKLKTAYSAIIPLAGYAIFYYVNGSCNSYIFICKYFVPISILSYILMLILHKYYFFRLHIKKSHLTKH